MGIGVCLQLGPGLWGAGSGSLQSWLGMSCLVPSLSVDSWVLDWAPLCLMRNGQPSMTLHEGSCLGVPGPVDLGAICFSFIIQLWENMCVSGVGLSVPGCPVPRLTCRGRASCKP